MKEEIAVDGEPLVMENLSKLGFKPLGLKKSNANGPDLFVTKGTRAYTVEIKNTRFTPRGSLQVPPVEPNRKSDDLIAIKLPNNYVLIEPMDDHLKACTDKGYRTLTVLA